MTWLVVHYPSDRLLYVWGDIDESAKTTFPGGQPFAGADDWGRFAWVRLAERATDVGFLVIDADGTKDVAEDRHVDPGVTPEIWLRPGDPQIYPTPPEPGKVADDHAIIHYRRPDGNYAGWGLHAWEGTFHKPRWGTPAAPDAFDSFGAVFRVPTRPDAVGLRFVLHRGDEKDLPDDQRLDLSAHREIWMLAGTPEVVRPDLGSLGPELDPARALAVFLDRTTIALPAHFADRADAFTLVASADEHTILPLTPRPGGLFQAQSRQFPHLRAYRAYAVPELAGAALGSLLRGRLLVTGRDPLGQVVALTSVQLPGVLDDLHADAAEAPLGLNDGVLSVWAPTARTVSLELSKTPYDEPKIHSMERDAATGIWSLPVKAKWMGRYYRYRVEVWHPAAQRIVTTSVTDPYSVSLSANSTHSQLVDLDDPVLKPPGWDTLSKPPAVAPARMQIAELHVRDFSIADDTVPPAHRGTFSAFAEEESTGMRHLRMLADAGLTHVHLLPAFDFATVPDRRSEQAAPACDLASFPPGSPEQQRAVMAVAEQDGFNWGYDPLHYTAPEGSYASDPNGSSRILEFRRMVCALNAAGLRVIMDVVYNHTMADGLAPFSVLDRIVPGYYHRLLDDGSVAESTCCSNTAPEHLMMGRLVVDSIGTWARDYKVDGFRFDLMGHHPRANILDVRRSLPDDIYLYGEGWNFGEVAYDARFAQATQVNMAGTGVGTFDDRLRDAVRGGGSSGDDPGVQGFATGLGSATPLSVHDRIKVGLSGALSTYRFITHTGVEYSGAQIDYNGSPGGYAVTPGECVSYVDAHDNEILYDAMAFKLPPTLAMQERSRLQILALSLVILGQGVGFFALGSERLRSKSLDRNSYNSGDWFNQIRWSAGNGFGVGLPPAPDNEDRWPWAQPLLALPSLIPSDQDMDATAARFAELLRIHRSSPVFGLPTADEVERRLTFPLGGPTETPGVIVMCLDGTGLDPRWGTVVTVFNATESTAVETVPALAEVPLILHPELVASVDPLVRTASAQDGVLTVPARSVAVFAAPLG
ncbi:pullulanase-type alpha-1,6-glucosidase [Actinoplanes sp. TFC3]|uniref:pullulanase-type alpha-1,6-glucosidase n=1 Tax=Actinoplanes sp. TFC3 TaxID=1710355 RepID=UPI000831DAC2|nr:pullulanase-type alpha-1,6-glucosidase [Actinoplanes sp. TFC3]